MQTISSLNGVESTGQKEIRDGDSNYGDSARSNTKVDSIRMVLPGMF